MFPKIVASVCLVIGILAVSVISDAVIARTWLKSEKATAAMLEPSCMIVGQPWPEWKWANTPWLSPPCDESKNAPAKANDAATQRDAGNASQSTPSQNPASNNLSDIKPEFK